MDEDGGVAVSEPLKVALTRSDTVRRLRPIEYYQLDNGTVVRVESYNPFPFEIRLAGNVSSEALNGSLIVYRVYFASSLGEVVRIAMGLGVETSNYQYNEATSTYIFNDVNVVFEYTVTTEFFRLAYRSPQEFNPDEFMANRVMPLVAPLLSLACRA